MSCASVGGLDRGKGGGGGGGGGLSWLDGLGPGMQVALLHRAVAAARTAGKRAAHRRDGLRIAAISRSFGSFGRAAPTAAPSAGGGAARWAVGITGAAAAGAAVAAAARAGDGMLNDEHLSLGADSDPGTKAPAGAGGRFSLSQKLARCVELAVILGPLLAAWVVAQLPRWLGQLVSREWLLRELVSRLAVRADRARTAFEARRGPWSGLDLLRNLADRLICAVTL